MIPYSDNFIEVNGVKLYYLKTGSGRPLIMLHGNGEDHTIFDAAFERLSRKFTCYLIDTRGHGFSSEPAEYHYSDMAEDIKEFIVKLSLSDVALYGFSDGGITGLMAAAGNNKITDLIVSGANLSPTGLKDEVIKHIEDLYKSSSDPKIKMMLVEPDISDELLVSIGARTLVTAGSEDMIKEEESRHIASLIPKAELKILTGETHESYIIHSEIIAKIIIDFLC